MVRNMKSPFINPRARTAKLCGHSRPTGAPHPSLPIERNRSRDRMLRRRESQHDGGTERRVSKMSGNTGVYPSRMRRSVRCADDDRDHTTGTIAPVPAGLHPHAEDWHDEPLQWEMWRRTARTSFRWTASRLLKSLKALVPSYAAQRSS